MYVHASRLRCSLPGTEWASQKALPPLDRDDAGSDVQPEVRLDANHLDANVVSTTRPACLLLPLTLRS